MKNKKPESIFYEWCGSPEEQLKIIRNPSGDKRSKTTITLTRLETLSLLDMLNSNIH
ncbi:hypothetical protein CIP107532_01978 [Corynebacterium diphtheriae]|nr:hypothetical protein CIP107532_01978 [Corynebacterium diphtheriae]CAB0660632.1 hypothetical protein CIP107562_01800 [Corynebacterium diphtheriae]CAB0824302.1 hypothetical protein FRC0290_01774 [Corynebacterium diphtheriae]